VGFVNYTGGRFVLDGAASASIKMGPFITADGTAVTDLIIAQSDVRLSRNDEDFAQKGDAASATHDENGWYDVALSASDTATQGNLLVAIDVAGALPVFRMFEVKDSPI